MSMQKKRTDFITVYQNYFVSWFPVASSVVCLSVWKQFMSH